MANEAGKNERRIPLPHWEGINAVVSKALAKKSEFRHAENIRSVSVGTVEKRKGQGIIGRSTSGSRFVADANYHLFFKNSATPGTRGLFRISASSEPISTFSINVWDDLNTIENVNPGAGEPILEVFVREYVVVSEGTFGGTSDSTHFYMDNIGLPANIYHLNLNDVWTKLADTEANNIPGAKFSSAIADGNVFLVNGRARNRYIKDDGQTVIDSSQAGHLYNSPTANLVNYYKNRLYLGDFTQTGVRYKTTILRSSYPVGIVSLVNGDVTAQTNIPLTDTKYIYADSGMNTYDVYRGSTKITTFTVSTVNETSVDVSSGAVSLLSSDEVWVAGTYTGEKQFRWVNNATAFGSNAKQYDTFKLAGGNETELTMLENIGNVMMIGSRNNLATWNDYTFEQFDLGIGVVSKRGYVKAYGTMYFLDYTGIYATSGALPSIISSPIQPYIDGATKEAKENSCAGKKGRSVFFTLGTVTLYNADGSVKRVLQDTVVEYNLLQQNWYVHTNVKASEFETYIDELDSDRLVFTSTDPLHQVKSFLEGQTDDTVHIFMQAETHPLGLSKEIEDVANPMGVVVEAERGALMQVYVCLDDSGQFYQIDGLAGKGITNLKITAPDPTKAQGMPPVAREIALSFRESSQQTPKLGAAAILFTPAGVSEAT